MNLLNFVRLYKPLPEQCLLFCCLYQVDRVHLRLMSKRFHLYQEQEDGSYRVQSSRLKVHFRYRPCIPLPLQECYP